MLVLARKEKERILIPAVDMTIAVIDIQGGVVRLGIKAPRDVAILREDAKDAKPSQSLIKMLEEQRKEKHELRNRLQGTRVGLSVLEKQLELGVSPEELLATLQQMKWSIIADDGKNSDDQLIEQASGPVSALLVEDQANERGLLESLLRLSGYNVVSARDGEEAMSYLQQVKRKPDVMLLDMGLPKMTGTEVIRQVRTDPETGQMKIFVISGQDKQSSVPVDQWFTKPLDPARLLENLSTVRKVG
jgi:carbon storage regulator CsrA